MPRPPSDRPYVCGPYQHRAQWRLVIYTPGVPGAGAPGGSRRRRPAYHRYFETREDALAWKREFRRQVAAEGRTIEFAVDEYLAALKKKKGNKAKSIVTSRYRLAALLDFEMPLVDLTKRRAQELYEEMVDADMPVRDANGEQVRDENGLPMWKPRYAVDTHHGSLMEARAFARFCQSKSWLTINPFEEVEPTGKKKRRKRQYRVDEARKYIATCVREWNDKRDRSAIAAMITLYFNLRASEVAQLIARDVDDLGRLLWVAYGEDEETGEDLAKTEASKRTARVPVFLVPILLYLSKHPATKDGHLFATEDGEPASRFWVRYHVQRLAKLAGTPRITTHGLRGTHASLRAAQGESDDAIARALGHVDDGTTARRHYIDRSIAPDTLAEQLGAVLDGIPQLVDPEATPRIEREQENEKP